MLTAIYGDPLHQFLGNYLITEFESNTHWPENVIQAEAAFALAATDYSCRLRAGNSVIEKTLAYQSFWQLANDQPLKLRCRCALDETTGLGALVKLTATKTRDRTDPAGFLLPCPLYTGCNLNTPSYSTPRWQLGEVMTPTGPMVIQPATHDHTEAGWDYHTFALACLSMMQCRLVYHSQTGKILFGCSELLMGLRCFRLSKDPIKLYDYFRCKAIMWREASLPRHRSATHKLLAGMYFHGPGHGTKTESGWHLSSQSKSNQSTKRIAKRTWNAGRLSYFPMWTANFSRQHPFEIGHSCSASP